MDSESEQGDGEEGELEQPWQFWKWLVPLYASILCVSLLLTLSFWVEVFGSAEFLIYVGDDYKFIYDLLPTMPTVCMILEFPFNMIEFEWPMLIIVELLFTLYMMINLLMVAVDPEHFSIYPDFDWFHHPGLSVLDVFICYLILAIIFAAFWALTYKVKLPRFAKRTSQKYDAMKLTSSSQQDEDAISVVETLD